MIGKLQLFISAVVVLAAVAAPVHAQVNKCKGPDGKISYQDTPCASGGEQINIKPKPSAQRTDISYGGPTDSDLAAQRDIQAAKDLDREREQRRREAEYDQRRRESDKRMDEYHDAYKWRTVGR